MQASEIDFEAGEELANAIVEFAGNPAAFDVLQFENASGKHFVGFGIVFFNLRQLLATFNFAEQQAKIVGEKKQGQGQANRQNDDQSSEKTMPNGKPGLEKSVLHGFHVTEHV